MANLSLVMKTIIAMVFVVVTSGACVEAQSNPQPAPKADAFIEQWIARFGSDDITYENGTLNLYIDGSSYERLHYSDRTEKVLGGTLIALFGSCSLAAGAIGIQGIFKGDATSGILGLVLAIGSGGFCLMNVSMFLDELDRDKACEAKKIPYLAFDAVGLSCMGKRCLQWCDVERVEISEEDVPVQSLAFRTVDELKSSKSATMTTSIKFERLNLVDKNNRVLFWMTANDRKCPISFSNISAFIEHYIATYGKKTETVLSA